MFDFFGSMFGDIAKFFLWIWRDFGDIISTVVFVELLASVKRANGTHLLLPSKADEDREDRRMELFDAKVMAAYPEAQTLDEARRSYYAQLLQTPMRGAAILTWLGIQPEPEHLKVQHESFESDLRNRFPQAESYDEALWLYEDEAMNNPNLSRIRKAFLWLGLGNAEIKASHE